MKLKRLKKMQSMFVIDGVRHHHLNQTKPHATLHLPRVKMVSLVRRDQSSQPKALSRKSFLRFIDNMKAVIRYRQEQ